MQPGSDQQGPQFGEPRYAWYLQGNQVASRQEPLYRVVWAADRFEGNTGAGRGEGFFDALEQGDFIVVWARAKVRTYLSLHFENIFYYCKGRSKSRSGVTDDTFACIVPMGANLR